MIISHTHRYIFIKTQKTGGTSLEIALSKYCGPDDIITPVTPEDEELRRSLGCGGPRNYYVPFRRYGYRDWANLLARGKGRRRFFNHIGAREIRALIDREVWNSYFKFSVERNPWDKVVSHYFWLHPSDPRPTLPEFVQSRRTSRLTEKGGFDLYAIAGEIAVDRVARYESLPQELEWLTERLKLPELPQMPRAKGKFRTDRRHYSEILGPAERDRIARVFAREIAEFGYQY